MQASDESAFAEYVAAGRDRVRRTAYLLCGDWHRADDLTQIAFVKLYGAWERIRDRGALDAYVRSCLVRATVDESRRPWRRERTVETMPETPVFADLAEQVTDQVRVREALAAVPAGQRAVLVLRYFEGLDVAATAKALSCSEGNVKSQTARGLVALKAALESGGTDGSGSSGGSGSGGSGKGEGGGQA
ncbi:SigE family RNA polymerase sigma factor [Nakamurella sp. YIM 132087]|uniref:SigE family RNA polymerase sigma factor n=1 Tax=Nakamurella alba TaxID=2665158 RepID=A0A7K1FPH5_9ACTN|nr:SigE family RNA polymerase sigma factor [Nakamurella alba]MTD16055.1 SigE family RNA polymerase sigma factor [Nakamurella alba]